MIKDKTREEIKALLLSLPAHKAPLWGMMSPQHMVEHLEMGIRMCNGKWDRPLAVKEELAARFKTSLISDKAFAKNIGTTESSALPALQYASMAEAVDGVLREIEDFEHYYRQKPEALHMHPYFGLLNEQEWRWFQHKHFIHHMSQFGLVEPLDQ